jgi:hypothetical protein
LQPMKNDDARELRVIVADKRVLDVSQGHAA